LLGGTDLKPSDLKARRITYIDDPAKARLFYDRIVGGLQAGK